MTGRLAGKVAFCTASGAGIGKATAIAFAREGARVIASDVDMASLRELADQGIAETHLLDVTQTQAVNRTALEVGPIDILLNAAGFVHHGTVQDTSETDWDFSFDLNVKSMHRTIQAFLPGMVNKGGGSIVNIASVASSIRAAPNRYVYGATKGAVIGLTKAVAVDYIKDGIRCNAICPGTIDSPSLATRIADQATTKEVDVEKVRQEFLDRQPMGRLGVPEEIAALAVHLASDESRYTTGTTAIADGGYCL